MLASRNLADDSCSSILHPLYSLWKLVFDIPYRELRTYDGTSDAQCNVAGHRAPEGLEMKVACPDGRRHMTVIELPFREIMMSVYTESANKLA